MPVKELFTRKVLKTSIPTSAQLKKYRALNWVKTSKVLTISNVVWPKNTVLGYRPFTGTSGLYCCVSPDAYSETKLRGWATALVGQENLKDKIVNNLHATVVWSKVVPEHTNMRKADPNAHYLAEFDHFEYWDGHDGDGYLVAVLTSDSILRLHGDWTRRGARHNFDDYLIHVTLHEKFRPTEQHLQAMADMSVRLKGSWLSFTNEDLQDVKR